ncbi:YceI family protein [Mycobacterium sp. ACS4331]|uniref:YceI family protein n=1 Tax=Mycobacterium sp. ACS4331 TaxID=1834121 RepID=UPI000A8840F6|nr:YceI family protein [Mycobacterium sp. ACS4331]
MNLDQSDGTLTLLTGVTGTAARMGHRLTIAMDSWRISVEESGGQPVSAQLTVDVDSLRVVGGEGGLTPLTGPEKLIVRANACKTLNAKRFPTIEFRAEQITGTPAGYHLRGPLTIHGVTNTIDVDVDVVDVDGVWQLGTRVAVSHKAFKIKPYSMAMGAMKVADIVTVEFSAQARP